MSDSEQFEVRYEEQLGDGSWVKVSVGPMTESRARAYYEQWVGRSDARNLKLFGADGEEVAP